MRGETDTGSADASRKNLRRRCTSTGAKQPVGCPPISVPAPVSVSPHREGTGRETDDVHRGADRRHPGAGRQGRDTTANGDMPVSYQRRGHPTRPPHHPGCGRRLGFFTEGHAGGDSPDVHPGLTRGANRASRLRLTTSRRSGTWP